MGLLDFLRGAPRPPSAPKSTTTPSTTQAAGGGDRHPDLLPPERMDQLASEAWAKAKSGQLASADEIDAWMSKNGVKHVADRGRLNDAVYKALGMDR